MFEQTNRGAAPSAEAEAFAAIAADDHGDAGVRVEDRGRARIVTLDRPPRNALTPETCAALRDAVAGAERVGARCLVLRGAGGNLCAGADLKAAITRGPEFLRGAGEILRRDFHGAVRALVGAPCPTVALVDGVAAGFGCDLALACDLRLVTPRARFGEVFVRRGLMPDGGGTWFLPRLIGLGRAMEMMLLGNEVGAEEALRIGLANQRVAVETADQQCLELAERIAAGPPLALRQIRRAARAAFSVDLETALAAEAEAQIGLLQSGDVLEGVIAFVEKRQPEFQGR